MKYLPAIALVLASCTPLQQGQVRDVATMLREHRATVCRLVDERVETVGDERSKTAQRLCKGVADVQAVINALGDCDGR